MATGEQVWAAAMTADLDRPSRDVLLTMAGLSRGAGQVVTSERELARMTGFSRSTVWDRLHRLEDLGWLERVSSRPTLFTFHLPAAAAIR